jgi:hypothetical protein
MSSLPWVLHGPGAGWSLVLLAHLGIGGVGLIGGLHGLGQLLGVHVRVVRHDLFDHRVDRGQHGVPVVERAVALEGAGDLLGGELALLVAEGDLVHDRVGSHLLRFGGRRSLFGGLLFGGLWCWRRRALRLLLLGCCAHLLGGDGVHHLVHLGVH